MVNFLRAFLPLILIVFCAPTLAANISVKADRDPVGLDENFRIIYTVEGSIDDEPDFSPLNKDLQLLGTSQSSQFNMANGSISRKKTFTLTVAPLRQGKITIAPISFGRDKSPAITVTVVAAGSTQPQATPSAGTTDKDLMFITSEVDTKSPYVQQQVILSIKVYRLLQWAEASLSDPGLEGIEARLQSLGKENSYTTQIKGKLYQVTELRHALFPQQSGDLTIKPFQVTAKFATGSRQQRSPFGGRSNDPFFDNFFSQKTYEKKTALSKMIKIKVKPIPAGFSGKHWLPAKDLQLQENWSGDISQIKVGEPITRTLALIGDGVGSGQLPDIGMKETDQLKTYPDQPVADEKVSNKGLLSTRTEKYAIIPSHTGKQTIPAIEIPWWNTTTDKMQVARIPASTLTIKGKTLAAAIPNTTSSSAGNTPVNNLTEDKLQTGSPVTDETPINTILMAAVITLTILWLLTLVILLKSRNRSTVVASKSSKAADRKASQKAALKQLRLACQKQQPAGVRDAIIQWAKVYWPENPPNSLEDIADRLPPESGDQITRLSASLYGQGDQNWDAQAIWESINQLPAISIANQKASNEALEPLYR